MKKKKEKKRYELSDGEKSITSTKLKRANKEVKIDAMRTWFSKNYADPAQNTPYESAEGGYIYIWGGPYEAEEELFFEFSGLVSEALISGLAEELNQISYKWTGHPEYDEADEYLFSSIAQTTEHYSAFLSAIENIERLIKMRIKDPEKNLLLKLLYVNVITAVETYLSDVFISSVGNDSKKLRKFIESTPDFKNEKISFSGVYEAVEQAEKKAKAFLMDVVWHHLHRVKPMFKSTLGVEFPKKSDKLFKAVLVRHDLVHRNGKSKEGSDHEISKEKVKEIISEAKNFAKSIEDQLPAVNAVQEKLDFDMSDVDL